MSNHKILIILFTLSTTLFGINIPINTVKKHEFSQSILVNTKIVQLSNAQQSISSLVNGHLQKYFVKPGQKVKKGQKLALIQSIVISKMTANYLSLKKQSKAVIKNYKAIKSLYLKGIESMQRFNNQSIKKNKILAKLNTLKSQLLALDINVNKLKHATSNLILFAHSKGRISALLKPLNSSININSSIITIVKNQAYFVKSYLPLKYAFKINKNDKIVINYAGKKIITHVIQIMPKLDETTQRIIVLSSINEHVKDLFIDSYVKATVYFGHKKKLIAVKKSALTLFDNQWVVFIPNKQKNNKTKQINYIPVVINIIAQDENFVAVLGIRLGQRYISAKSYYVKSALLKSSLNDGD